MNKKKKKTNPRHVGRSKDNLMVKTWFDLKKNLR
jgi:hypothetical protein